MLTALPSTWSTSFTQPSRSTERQPPSAPASSPNVWARRPGHRPDRTPAVGQSLLLRYAIHTELMPKLVKDGDLTPTDSSVLP
jgi:hypothetical protein